MKDKSFSVPAVIVYEGKVYYYVATDMEKKGNTYGKKEWNVYSSMDLENWKLESQFEEPKINMTNRSTVKASHLIVKNDDFFWYVLTESDDNIPDYRVDVIKSDHPVQEWQDTSAVSVIPPDMMDELDDVERVAWKESTLSVSMNENGEAYLFFGKNNLYYVKLKENMVDLENSIKKVYINGFKGSFAGGAKIHQHKDTYYMTFTVNSPQVIGYATAKNLAGPWEYKGIIMDESTEIAPFYANIFSFQEQSYFIYHSKPVTEKQRSNGSVAIEEIYYQDGLIASPVTPTASGTDGPSYLIQQAGGNLALRINDERLVVSVAEEEQYDFRWHQTPGLIGSDQVNIVSFQSENRPGFYLVNQDNRLQVKQDDGSTEFAEIASFRIVPGLSDKTAYSIQPYNKDQYFLFMREDIIEFRKKEELADLELATFHLAAKEDIVPELQTKPVKYSESSEEPYRDGNDSLKGLESSQMIEKEETNWVVVCVVLLSAILIILIIRKYIKS